MSSASLECRDATKAFGGAPVLRGVSLTLMLGTVTALVGENGAGKSTLMKIVSGQVRPDGRQHRPRRHNPQPRRRPRLGVTRRRHRPQELAPIVDRTVYENLFVGREVRASVGLLDRRAMIRRAREMLDVFGVSIDSTGPVRTLSVALQQIVEIVKTTSRGANVVLLDEPTAAIADREVDLLYGIVLGEQGVAIHGEPGIRTVDEMTARDLAGTLVEPLLRECPVEASGRVAVLLNGLGATKYEELFVLWKDIGPALENAGVEVVLPEVGEFVTSLDMAGCSLRSLSGAR